MVYNVKPHLAIAAVGHIFDQLLCFFLSFDPQKTFVATKAATKFVRATDVLKFGEKQQGKPLDVKKNDPATIVVLRSVLASRQRVYT